MTCNLSLNASVFNQSAAEHVFTGTHIMRIGIDFDNTIAGYDDIFTEIAKRKAIISDDFCGDRLQLRKLIRSLEGGEKEWMSIQGQVYGKYMDEAKLIDGVDNFLRHCYHSDIEVFIVSHKTEFGHYDPERIHLRSCATTWLEAKGFFDREGYNLSRDHVFFESTREAKIRRIHSLGCTHFIDDLDLILTHPNFPEATQRFLLDRYHHAPASESYGTYHNWDEITDAVFGH